MDAKQVDLYEFLAESELQQYYNSIKNELKITNSSHLKYAADEDLKQLGLSRPEIRRLRKFYDKFYPHSYLSKIKRLLQPPRKEDSLTLAQVNLSEPIKSQIVANKVPNNKHIIPADTISVNKQLGTGEFGIVQQGVWTNGNERIQVAIKCLCRERMQSNPMEFLKEAAIMHANEHENIVRLYGVVLDTESLMLVTELAHLRSLLECLKDPGLRVSFLTVPTLCEFAMQICNGMMYLENKRLIHRDLAARNILVFSKNKVKISDFGLSRALGVGKDYYKTNFNVNLKLPIAWCAPECINYLRFTNSSDVWAFGVCLWEMFSYGFQPWAALTGLQILEAIDEPNYQRLEQPDCCPREYYNLMLKCWQHDQFKRPKFSQIYEILPDIKPEQLKAVNNCELKKDNLLYRQGEIITVLDKNTNSSSWKGVLNSGKTGLFNPANTVAHIEGLPTSTNRDSFCRTNERTSSKRKLRTEMISMPQNDLKHTGHVGLDGAYFGDVAFLGSSQNYNRLPRQIVTPYKPSEDIEQTPLLLPPTPTSLDSLQTASGYFPEELPSSSTNPTFINSNENTPKQHNNFGSSFDFPPKPIMFSSSNPFASDNSTPFILQNNNNICEGNSFTNANLEEDFLSKELDKINPNLSVMLSTNKGETQHEYHEISDDEITAEKVFDLGPSLLDEINSMFGSISNHHVTNSPDDTKKKLENSEFTLKLNRNTSIGDNNGNKSKKKAGGTVKPISVKDEKILNHAIEIANEISARSMTDLISEHAHPIESPKRKFSFRFPHLSHHSSSEKYPSPGIYYNNNSSNAMSKERKNFSEELQSIPDLQNTITEEGREAYNCLIENKSTNLLQKVSGNSFSLSSCSKTLPKNFIKLSERKICELQDAEISVPIQHAPRPSTLPHHSIFAQKNTSKVLRDKNLSCIVNKSNLKISTVENNDVKLSANGIGDENKPSYPCESPSYMTNTSYIFPSSTKSAQKNVELKVNVIPLPPRDRNKVVLTNAKRHVRKHPLVIPGYDIEKSVNGTRFVEGSADFKDLTKNKIETISPRDFKKSDKVYENIDDFSLDENINTDSASLHFESILESDLTNDDILTPSDVVDGICPFAILKEQYKKSKEINLINKSRISGLYVNEDELLNLDIEKNDLELLPNDYASTKHLNQNLLKQTKTNSKHLNESKNPPSFTLKSDSPESSAFDLCDEHQLLDKEMQLKNCNSVSCEDLLKFADKNCKNSKGGLESDEIRIMLKILGKNFSLEKCLTALDFIDWDVHKALKLIRLQNLIDPLNLNLNECVDELEKHDWDIQATVLKLEGLKK